MNILLLHGWKSTPGGLKPTYLKDHGHTVLNPALPDDDFDAAVRIAQAEFDQGQPDVVVGSSRGGAVAMNIESGNTPLVLLCPAWKTWGTATTVKPGTLILHSRADETVPFADSGQLVKNSGLPLEALIEVGTEHRLADPESLAVMLEACEEVRQQEGEWNDRSEAFAKITLLCAGCYEVVKQRNQSSVDERNVEGFVCRICGEFHAGLPMDFGADAPAPYYAIPKDERDSRCDLTSDLCVIDEEHFFIRGCLEIPVVDGPGPHGQGGCRQAKPGDRDRRLSVAPGWR
jgi:hypothetical protein